eukprot:Skav229233  [mRNA]  locus=scaffold864:323070:323507:- [translate_table: standard]
MFTYWYIFLVYLASGDGKTGRCAFGTPHCQLQRSHLASKIWQPERSIEEAELGNEHVFVSSGSPDGGSGGRRGNIVQVYPSVEYDFVPSELSVEKGDILHFQWTGSDANPNGNAGAPPVAPVAPVQLGHGEVKDHIFSHLVRNAL